VTPYSSRIFDIRTVAPIFQAMAATMQRMPSTTPQIPSGQMLTPATSRKAGPIQQIPGNMRTPKTANRTGPTALIARRMGFTWLSLWAMFFSGRLSAA
jgi:hypothetical protein